MIGCCYYIFTNILLWMAPFGQTTTTTERLNELKIYEPATLSHGRYTQQQNLRAYEENLYLDEPNQGFDYLLAYKISLITFICSMIICLSAVLVAYLKYNKKDKGWYVTTASTGSGSTENSKKSNPNAQVLKDEGEDKGDVKVANESDVVSKKNQLEDKRKEERLFSIHNYIYQIDEESVRVIDASSSISNSSNGSYGYSLAAPSELSDVMAEV